MNDVKVSSIEKVMSRILYRIYNTNDETYNKEILSNLRNSIGKELSDSMLIWPLIFENIPKDYLSKNGVATNEERAIIDALRLYALHQQGNSTNVNLDTSIEGYANENIGKSLKLLRNENSKNALDRRFNILITSNSYEELIHHLRGMINLIKRDTNIKVNYPLLARDLYRWQGQFPETVRLMWGQSYYFVDYK